jgi:hypothetical protein
MKTFKEFLFESKKSDHEEIQERIISKMKEKGVSIRAVDFDDDAAVVVYYNYEKEAPENFKFDKSECSKLVVDNVKPLLIDAGNNITSVSKATDQPGVGKIYFFRK